MQLHPPMFRLLLSWCENPAAFKQNICAAIKYFCCLRLKDSSSSKRYVITNPKANFTLLPTDQVYMVCRPGIS